MTPEEMACWIADSPPKRVARDGVRWRALHDRALEVVRMTRNDALEEATLVAETLVLEIDGIKTEPHKLWIADAIRELKEKN